MIFKLKENEYKLQCEENGKEVEIKKTQYDSIKNSTKNITVVSLPIEGYLVVEVCTNFDKELQKCLESYYDIMRPDGTLMNKNFKSIDQAKRRIKQEIKKLRSFEDR